MNNFENFLKILCEFYIKFSKGFAEYVCAECSHSEKFTLRKLLKNLYKICTKILKNSSKF